MNSIFEKIGQYFGQKPISHYPELYHKNSSNVIYEINLATSSRIYDPPTTNSSINWKLI